jgi:hypothetical protein
VAQECYKAEIGNPRTTSHVEVTRIGVSGGYTGFWAKIAFA